ncbi:MAG: NEW3 domain-containing protein, partial [Candidatus Nanohaloarchaea archaeon]|nr:NEW3 domain-containing protein [Candidatus Nanohaloarchaea archaeon]
ESEVARIMPLGTNQYQTTNRTYVKLTNPLTIEIETDDVSDSTPPQYQKTFFERGNNNPTDQDDLNCNTHWTDNIEIDKVNFQVTGPDMNITRDITVGSNETWINETVDSTKVNSGTITCNVTATDLASLQNWSVQKINVSDRTPPQVTANHTPYGNIDVKPDIQINVTANITEYNKTRKAVMQYRKFNNTWNNKTLNLIKNITNHTQKYNSNFTPTNEGTWQYRFQVNDTTNNTNVTQPTNLSVFFRYRWNRTPTNLKSHSLKFNTNKTIGNITINNTGDKNLTFKLTSDWFNTSRILYNGTTEDNGFNTTITPGNNKTIPITVIARPGPEERTETLNITLNATNQSSTPPKRTTNASITSFAGGPFLQVEFTKSNISLTQGDTGVTFESKVTNKGNETADNVTLYWDLPEGWTIEEGTNITNTSTLDVDESLKNNINISVASDAPTGTKTITATTTCCNDTQETQRANKDVVVDTKDKTTTQTTTKTTQTTGGGGDTGGGGGLSPEERQKLLQSQRTIHITPGKDTQFQIQVENPFDKGKLANVQLQITGLLSQYLSIQPTTINSIPQDGKDTFNVSLEAPRYFTTGKHILNATITGKNDWTYTKTINGTTITGGSSTPMKEQRKVTLWVHPTTKQNATKTIKQANKSLKQLKESNLSTEEIERKIQNAKQNLKQDKYGNAQTQAQQALQLIKTAKNTQNLLKKVNNKIENAEYRGLDTPRTERMKRLAQAALNRGDYTTALGRLKNAQQLHALETKGEFNYINFIYRNPWTTLTALILAALLTTTTTRLTKIWLTKRQLRHVQEEQQEVVKSMKVTQHKTFVLQKVGMGEYQSSMKFHHGKISQLVGKEIQLKTKIQKLTNPLQGEMDRLIQEAKRVRQELQNLQKQYLEEKTVQAPIYHRKAKALRQRLSTVEGKIAELHAEKIISETIGWRKYLPQTWKTTTKNKTHTDPLKKIEKEE